MAFGRRRFRRRMGFQRRRATRFVRQVARNTGPLVAKKVLVDAFDIPDFTSAAYDTATSIPLVIAQENTDREVEANGTVPAQISVNSHVVGIKLQGHFLGGSSNVSTLRWMLIKSPQADTSAQNAMDNFHNADETDAARRVRANIYSKGIISLNTSTLVTPFKIFIRRKTLHRLSFYRESDTLMLVIASNAQPAGNPDLFMFGNIYVRET